MTSTIKVNNIQNQCGQNIINENSNTITIGASGDTIALASGASQSGFGRTGTVDWQTGSIKTATFTAASGEGYFCNTAGGSFEVDLPAGSVGAIVSIQDYNNTFDANLLTVDPNGSEKINGGDAGESIELSTEGQGVTFVYVDATVGWRSVQDNTFSTAGQAATFITATGGTITQDGDYKVHSFTGPGTFTVCSVGNPAGSDTVSYMVVAGGGEGGSSAPSNGGGGGGAGGFREGKSPQCTYTSSPIACTSGSNNGLPVSAQGYPITVGAGGAQQPQPSNNMGNPGSNSSFSTITSAGGGGGKMDNNPAEPATAGQGGSGGGGGAGAAPSRRAGGPGNTPSVSPAQGTDGGTAGPNSDGIHGGGGGGGAGAIGGNTVPSNNAGTGGTEATTNITGSPVAYAGGGGGGSTGGNINGRGAASPGGTGGIGGYSPNGDGAAGTTNRGGGGGAGGWPAAGSARGGGGSGIVVIRYKFQ
jgi:hypothetical protein